MSPRVSVVMPCLNGAKHVLASVRSVLEQTMSDLELIFVDNGSTDDTLRLVNDLDDPRVNVFLQPVRGVSRARNLGIQVAKSPLLAFLDSDDTWESDFLMKLCGALDRESDAVLAYCGWQNLGVQGPRGQPFVPPDYETPTKTETMLGGCRWPIHACVVRTEVVRECGGFDTSLVIGEDYLLWMEACARGRIKRVPEVLAYYHHHDGVQATRNLELGLMDPFRAKLMFLERYPSCADALGAAKIESLTWGNLLKSANALYWSGEIEAVRVAFRRILLSGRGSWRDRARMLPSLLPLALHRKISGAAQRRQRV